MFKYESSVVIYSCRSKSLWLTFFCGSTHKKKKGKKRKNVSVFHESRLVWHPSILQNVVFCFPEIKRKPLSEKMITEMSFLGENSLKRFVNHKRSCLKKWHVCSHDENQLVLDLNVKHCSYSATVAIKWCLMLQPETEQHSMDICANDHCVPEHTSQSVSH